MSEHRLFADQSQHYELLLWTMERELAKSKVPQRKMLKIYADWMQVCEWDLIRGDSILSSAKLDVPPLTTGFLCSPFQDLMTFLAYNDCSSHNSPCMICITDRINFFLFKLSRKGNHIQVSSRLSFGKDQKHNSAVVDGHFSNRIYIKQRGCFRTPDSSRLCTPC